MRVSLKDLTLTVHNFALIPPQLSLQTQEKAPEQLRENAHTGCNVTVCLVMNKQQHALLYEKIKIAV